MSFRIQPIHPDWEGLLKNLSREATPERVRNFEDGRLCAGFANAYPSKLTVIDRLGYKLLDHHSRDA
jgi:hypothetical protein